MKKLVSILVVLAMLMSMVPAVFAAESEVIYSQENLELTVTYNKYGEAIADIHEYTWRATGDGTVTVNITSVDPGVALWFGDSLPKFTTEAASYDFDVTEGTEYTFKINGSANWEDCAATVSFNLTFTAGEGETVVETETYVISGQTLSVGENTVTLEENALNSLYEFAPAAAGVYEFTAAEGIQLGYWGTTAYPFDGTETKSNTLTFTLTDANQSILVGVVNGENTSNVKITVTKTGEASTEPAYETIVYENVATPVSFDKSLYENLKYVSVSDGVTDTAVLGTDGYYHLNSKEGDILYVSFSGPSTSSVSLVGAWGYGAVKYVEYTDDGEISSVTDYQDALAAYMMAVNNGGNYTYGNSYHPLTADLITMLKNIGANNGWYGADGWVGDSEDAWMFSCLTMDLIENEDETPTGSGTEEDPYIITSLPYDIFTSADDVEIGVFYLYTAEKDGAIRGSGDGYTGVLSVIDENGDWEPILESAYDVSEGDEILLCHWAYSPLDSSVTLDYSASTSGGDTGDGGDEGGDTGDDPVVPDEGEWSGTDVAVAADESIVITYTPETDGVLSVAISCETGWQVDVNGEESYWSDYSESPLSFNLTAGTTYTVTIYPYDEANEIGTCDAVMTYELTWTPAAKENAGGSGTKDDPFSLLVNSDNHVDYVAGGNPVWFEWTAPCAGSLTLTFDEIQTWITLVRNGSYLLVDECASYTLKVAKGDVVQLGVEAYDYTSDYSFDFYAAFEASSDEGGETSNELTVGDNYIEVLMDATSEYTFTATETGTVCFILTDFLYAAEYTDGWMDNNDYMDEFTDYTYFTVNEVPMENYFHAFEVVDGETYDVVWTNYSSWSDYAGTMTITYDESLMPKVGFSEDLPVELYTDDCPTDSIEIGAGVTAYYLLYDFSDATFTVEGADAYVVVSYFDWMSYSPVNETYYPDENGVVSVYIPNGYMTIQIVNNGDEAAVFGLDYYFAEGSQMKPAELVHGENSCETSGQYYYTYTAEADMNLYIGVDESSTGWGMNYDIEHVNGSYTWGDYAEYGMSDGKVVIALSAGDVLNLNIGSLFGNAVALTVHAHMVGEGTVTQEAICVEDGVMSYVCTECDETVTDTIPATGTHVSSGDDVTVDPTCTEDGSLTYTCAQCEEVQVVVIPASGHVDEDGDLYCDVCELSLALRLGDNDVYTDNTDSACVAESFIFEAPQSGTLYITLSNLTYNDGVTLDKYYLNYMPFLVDGVALTNGHYGTIEVEAGQTVIFTWNSQYSYYSWLCEGNLNLSYEGHNPAPGSEADPIVLDASDCPAETIEIPADSTVYYSMEAFAYSNVTVTGEGAYVVYNDVTYSDTDGDGIVQVYVEENPALVQIGNSGDSAAAFTVTQTYPLGHMDNPEEITDGQTVVDIKSDGYYLQFTAECDGVVSFTISGEDWMYMISDEDGRVYQDGEWVYAIWGNYWTACVGTEDSSTVEIEVLMGEVYQIQVCTVFDPDDWFATINPGTIYVDVAAEYDHVDDDEDGLCDICGTEMTTVLLGDVNGDGLVNIADAMLALQYATKVIGESQINLEASDVNGDGLVNIADAMLLLQYATKVINKFPVS